MTDCELADLRTARVMLANYADHDESHGQVEDAQYTRGIVEGIDTNLRRAAQLADRIESLNWSRTSLQHQLVMSAAVLALRGSELPELENPVGEMQLLLADLVNSR